MPDNAQTTVTITSTSGEPIAVLSRDTPFLVRVEVPAGAGPAPQALTVTFQTGEVTRELTLRRAGRNPARYTSDPLTLAEGAGDGAMGALATGNGAEVHASYGTATAIVHAYDTPLDAAIGIADDTVHAWDRFVRQVLISLRGTPPSAATKRLSQWGTQMLWVVENARRTLNDPHLGRLERAHIAAAWVRVIQDGRAALRPAGEFDPAQSLHGHMQTAAREVHDTYHGAFAQFLADASVGFYQCFVGGLPLVAPLWTLFTGTDILGRGVDGWEYAEAVLDTAGQAALLALPVAVRSRYDVQPTLPRLRRYGTPPVRGSIVRAEEGTFVRDIHEVGFTQDMAWKVNREGVRMVQEETARAARAGEPPRFSAVRIGIRPLDRGTLRRVVEEGLATKPEPIKPKSVNPTDIQGGWADPAHEKLIGFYSPEHVLGSLGLDPGALDVHHLEPTPPRSDIPAAVWDRARQRIDEFFDQGPAIERYRVRGLVDVRDGLLIDHGISEYRLDEHHELAPIHPDGPRTVRPGPMTGDPDLWWFADEQGRPLPKSVREALVERLRVAGIKHPDVISWDIENDAHYTAEERATNIGIRDKIRRAHGGTRVNGRVVPADGAQGIVWFKGWNEPRAIGYDTFVPPARRLPRRPHASHPVPDANEHGSVVVPVPPSGKLSDERSEGPTPTTQPSGPAELPGPRPASGWTKRLLPDGKIGYFPRFGTPWIYNPKTGNFRPPKDNPDPNPYRWVPERNQFIPPCVWDDSLQSAPAPAAEPVRGGGGTVRSSRRGRLLRLVLPSVVGGLIAVFAAGVVHHAAGANSAAGGYPALHHELGSISRDLRRDATAAGAGSRPATLRHLHRAGERLERLRSPLSTLPQTPHVRRLRAIVDRSRVDVQGLERAVRSGNPSAARVTGRRVQRDAGWLDTAGAQAAQDLATPDRRPAVKRPAVQGPAVPSTPGSPQPQPQPQPVDGSVERVEDLPAAAGGIPGGGRVVGIVVRLHNRTDTPVQARDTAPILVTSSGRQAEPAAGYDAPGCDAAGVSARQVIAPGETVTTCVPFVLAPDETAVRFHSQMATSEARSQVATTGGGPQVATTGGGPQTSGGH